MSCVRWTFSIVALSLALAAPLRAEDEPSRKAGAGSQDRGFLGVGVAYEEENGEGRLRVVDTVAGGPAEQAGLRDGDLITAVGGVGFRFTSTLEQYEAFSWVRPGDRLELTVLRGDAALTLELTAGETPAGLARQAAEAIRQDSLARQHRALLLLGQGSGVEITVSRDAETGDLELSAPGRPAELIADLELYLGKFPPLADSMARLEPGDSFKIRIVSEGAKMNMELLGLPPYLDAE